MPTTDHIAPAPLALPLLKHQEDGVRFALHHRAAYLSHDMGTGKTATAIGWATSLVAAGHGPVLIVVPPSLRTNWAERELPRFAPHLRVTMLSGNKPHQVEPADVYVIGDMSISHWADTLTGQLVTGKDQRGRPIRRQVAPPMIKAIVLDEAHRAKNKSQRTDAIKRVANACGPYRLLLSGTPAPNGRNVELLTQIDILGDDAWQRIGGRAHFLEHYCPQADRFGSRSNHDSAGLHDKINNAWMQRLLRDEVLDLPNKGRSAIAVSTSGKAHSDYIKAENDLIGWLREEGRCTLGAQKAEALVRLTTLRSLAGAAKIKATISYAKEILHSTDGGVFIVAEHKQVISDIMHGLAAYQPVAVKGGMSDKAKQQAVDAFNTGTARVMVGQIIAAGVGLTLHGDGKNTRVLVVQLPWTPADLQQAEDRLHRMGQINDVTIEILLAHIQDRWTIDERLWSILETKHYNASELIDGDGEYMLEDIQEELFNSYRTSGPPRQAA